ncbi:MAG: DUF2461 domain-containing protein [Deltaproteobacteria bacterium]|nr:DUF2461 domain-containing protein [Deltaproteobacteria bacterium]
MPTTTYAPNPFRPAVFTFLRELEKNNSRDWFQANKARYEDQVKEPALQFISDFGPHLRKISPHFLAIPKASGGSLFRIYRDVRFSKDKSPYKTHLGIQFRHERARDAHAPGFYLHLEAGTVFVGAGMWHPDGPSLKKIRDGLVADPGGWRRATSSKAFDDGWKLEGESLKRPPRGYDAEHPLVDDLRRKDFIIVRRLSQTAVLAADFPQRFVALCRQTAPFMRYLCGAVDAPF